MFCGVLCTICFDTIRALPRKVRNVHAKRKWKRKRENRMKRKTNCSRGSSGRRRVKKTSKDEGNEEKTEKKKGRRRKV